MTRFCFICKKQVSNEPLDAIPETRLCTQYANEIQKYGGEFVLSAEQEKTSKKSSMKVNYGGISTRVNQKFYLGTCCHN